MVERKHTKHLITTFLKYWRDTEKTEGKAMWMALSLLHHGTFAHNNFSPQVLCTHFHRFLCPPLPWSLFMDFIFKSGNNFQK
jgi:hypothetical protein